jgi:hypothetical protein
VTTEEVGRRVRLVLLLRGLEKAGIAKVDLHLLHFVAYLSNALSPVWDLIPIEKKVLKQLEGPFYPQLQGDLDRLVGMGVASVHDLQHVRNQEGRWRLQASYSLRHEFADPVLEGLDEVDPDSAFRSFLFEICLAIAALPLEGLDRAPDEDANYADPTVGLGNVVDFAEWQSRNFAANAARALGSTIPGSVTPTRGEMLHLYMRHLGERVSRGRL